MSRDGDQEVMFFLPHLGGGGAEMNAARVSSCLPENGFTPSFAVVRSFGTYETLLRQGTPVTHLHAGRINSSTIRMVRSIHPLRRAIAARKPAILCPVMDAPSLAAILATRGAADAPKVVLSIQVSPLSQYHAGAGVAARAQLRLMRALYPRADHVIALSDGVAQELLGLVPRLEGRISVVPNAGPPLTAPGRAGVELSRPVGKKLIVACGRLVEQKGYRYLLEALARLRDREDAHLWILGEGPLRASLGELADSLGLRDRVEFLGFRENPHAYMQAADVFVLSSLWEGFGNVIVEAMAAGTAVVATDCPHGPSEIIQDEENGILVPPADPAALAHALARLLGEAGLRSRLSEAALQRSQDFDPPAIARRYAEVFSKVLGR